MIPTIPTIPSSNTSTSFQAALSMEQSADRLRALVLNYIVEQGDHGATDQEIQQALSLTSNTENPRRWELSKKLDLVVDSGRRRRTNSGRQAIVWVVSKGRQ